MALKSVLVGVLGFLLLAWPGFAVADDDEDRARELLEALGGSTPVDPESADAEEMPEAGEEPAGENDEAQLSFAEGGKLPGDLSELLEEYAGEDGELTDEAAASVTEEVQASAASDTAEGRELREALDRDGDGAVNAAEAQAGVGQARAFRQKMRQQAGQLFFAHDENTDGELSILEFAAMVQEMRLPGSNSEAAVQAMFVRIDADQDGAISAAEAQRAANAMAEAMPPAQRQRQAEDRPGQGGQEPLDQNVVLLTQQVLQQFDQNGDGMIGRREAAANPLIAANFNAADTNGDSRLSGEEIYIYIKSQ